MFQRIGQFLGSTIGKKIAMSLSGLMLTGFLIAHLAGNLLFFKDGEHEAFDSYAHTLEGNPLLPLAEIGLLLLFLTHLFLAFVTTRANREARKTRYAVQASRGERTIASSSMLITGLVVLAFVVVHLLDFRFRERAADGLAAMLARRLSEPVGAGIYFVGVAALGLHLSHALRSALQSIGANHPRFNAAIQRGGLVLAIVLFLGFASFPIVMIGSRATHSMASQPAAAGQSTGQAAVDR